MQSEKDIMRKVLRQKRLVAVQDEPLAAFQLRDNFLAELDLPQDSIVAGYVAQGGELDPAPLMEALSLLGHPVALPCIIQESKTLLFRLYKAGMALEVGPYNIPQPSPDAPQVRPDVVLVPLLGFDRTGARLGQGGGYYDRALATLRAEKDSKAYGVCYGEQEILSVPEEGHDQKLDLILTEDEIIDPRLS